MKYKNNMQDKLNNLKKTVKASISVVKDNEALASIINNVLGRKNGELTNLMKELKDLPIEIKKTVGRLANDVRNEIENLIETKKEELETISLKENFSKESMDLTAPVLPKKDCGHLHPVSLVQRDLEKLFISMGFTIAVGPELESDYFNFETMNMPANHPARDMQDTFYIKGHLDQVMRTHTSSVQVRSMNKIGVPLKIVSSGVCFRNESTDSRHEHTFHQLEGLVVDKEITFAHMKGVLEVVVQHLYGKETKMRLRPKHYPFVEPGVNGEISCFLCKGKGCKICKNTGWMEIFGAGMVHPYVLKAGGIDPEKYQGFAFGFGLSRLVMLKYGIDDARILMSSNLRFAKQF